MYKKILCLLTVIIEILHGLPIADDLLVTLPDGQIQGAAYVNENNFSYYGFRGIPYAAPPIGELRFEAPQLANPWNGILDATQDSRSCISSNYLTQPQMESEDCLYINVYVPVKQTAEKLPVMFWIYGGAFIEGSSIKNVYGPDFLLEQGVIVVSFNYRLNVFGFISTEDEVLPGNLGLKDQVLALKWTRQNIENFGGDPEQITVFGQSAGAGSVGLHLISKQSAGLFRAAILESGSALVFWSNDWQPRTSAFKLADSISRGNYGNDSQVLKSLLKSTNLDQIMNAYQLSGIHPYPTIEIDSEDAFITESHYKKLVNGDFTKVPILIGVCSEESLMALRNLNNARRMGQAFDNTPETVVPDDLRPNSSYLFEAAEKVKNIYLNDSETFGNNLVKLAEYFSDNRYVRGVIKHAEIASAFVPVYFYEFAYYGRPTTEAFIDGAEKAGHAAEIPFLFNGSYYAESSNDLLTQNRMVTLWTNFAKYLDPTPTENELLSNITWPVASPENLQYLSINKTLEIRSSFKRSVMEKWDDIFESYGRKPFITY